MLEQLVTLREAGKAFVNGMILPLDAGASAISLGKYQSARGKALLSKVLSEAFMQEGKHYTGAARAARELGAAVALPLNLTVLAPVAYILFD